MATIPGKKPSVKGTTSAKLAPKKVASAKLAPTVKGAPKKVAPKVRVVKFKTTVRGSLLPPTSKKPSVVTVVRYEMADVDETLAAANHVLAIYDETFRKLAE